MLNGALAFRNKSKGIGEMAGRLKVFRSGITVWRGMSTTVTATATATVEIESKSTVLFRRLVSAGRENSDTKVSDVLDNWETQVHPLQRAQILSFASQLRRFNKPHLALKLFEWMEKKKKQLNDADEAVRIDLFFKAEGILLAENYFNSLDQSAKTDKTYGALLSCYCRGKMLEKATKLFQKMVLMDLHISALDYMNIMSLYMKVGLQEKVPLVFQEMEENNLTPTLYAYNQLINSYATLKDIDAVEQVFERMKSKNIKLDWFTFGNLATIYLNAGLIEKAKGAVEELEKLTNSQDPQAFHTLINLYANLSDEVGVARAWKSCKSKFTKPRNTSYLIMHLALSKLGDYDGLEKLYKEWESTSTLEDSRIPNVLLESYLKRGMIEKASALYESVITRGIKPNLRTRNSYISVCLKRGQIDLALHTLEVGASEVSSERKNDWFPTQGSVDAFLIHLKENNDVVYASKFCEIMKRINRLDIETERMVKELCPL